MIQRERYVKQIRGFYDSDLIKIITGVRRSGKSIILEQIKNEIAQNTDNIIYLDFEDMGVSGTINSCDKLLQYVADNKKDGLCYVFLDEIQNLDNWANACKTLRLKNCSVFITGSNSKLLSNEFTKELSGRYVSFMVRPFVYKELLEYSKQLNKNVSVIDYLVWGGFPKRIEFDGIEQQKLYLNDLNRTIVFNDIITRYKIHKIDEFQKFVNYVLVSNSRIFSKHSISNFMKANGSKVSENTIKKWLYYLEQAYIISSIPQYSTATKEELSFYEKIYNCDVSLNSIRKFDGRYDLTHNLENIVYNELLYMGYDVKVYNNKGKEIDFLAIKDGLQYFIQVAYSLENEETYNREFKAFNGIDDINKKIIISNDEIDYSTSNIKHIKLTDFLLLNDLTTI